MTLLELVKIFREGRSYEDFCKDEALNSNSEVIEIYMEKPFDITNKLAFFEIENTEGSIEYEHNGVLYHNLFDFYYFIDVIEESKNENNLMFGNEDIVKKIFNYALYDS